MKIPTSLSRVVARQGLVAQMNSPKLLFGAGVVGMISSTVLACRATLKLEEVLDETQHNLSVAKQVVNQDDERYTEQDYKKDVAIIYVRSGVSLAKLYGPAILLGSASIAMLTKSHDILTKRNAALTAAYATVDKAFKEYRAKVVKKYGEDADRLLRYDTEEIAIVDDETGKTITVTRVGPEGASMYARFFDEYSSSWSKDPEVNFLFVRCQQNYANDLLKARGHIFLNEVYDMLGLERSQAGSVVGWIMGPDGDNMVDFGLFDPDNREARDFVNGREGSILLDFNVDGVIFDKIDTPREALSWQNS
jgi:hypothetical protein